MEIKVQRKAVEQVKISIQPEHKKALMMAQGIIDHLLYHLEEIFPECPLETEAGLSDFLRTVSNYDIEEEWDYNLSGCIQGLIELLDKPLIHEIEV